MKTINIYDDQSNCIFLTRRIQNITKNGMSNNCDKNNFGIKQIKR